MRNQMLRYFVSRCYYYHKKTLKPTTKIGVELIGRNLIMHRFPQWMPLRVHLCLERMMKSILKMDPKRKIYFSKIGIPYHIIHGLICDYPMMHIIKFIQNLGDDRFYMNTYHSDKGG